MIFSNFDLLPEFLKSADLVKLGLFPNEDALSSARQRGEGPQFIKLKRKVLYPKVFVLDYVKKHLVLHVN